MDTFKENIKEMNNLDIKEKILMVNKRQLKNIEKASYFNIFNSILGVESLLDQEKKADKFEYNREIDNFYSNWEAAINSVILSMEKTPNKEKKEIIDDLKKTRKEIYNISLILEGYKIELLYIEKIIDEYGVRLLSEEKYKNTPYDTKKIDELIKIVKQILDENKENHEKYIYIISEIISILPMRLVKENYYHIIKNTLMRNFENYNKSQVEIQINEYKKQFDSSFRDGYASKFDYCFTEIQKMKKLELKDKNLEDLSELVRQNAELSKSVNGLININFILGLITNMNMVIALRNEDSVKAEIETIYNQWRDILINNNEDELKNFKVAIKSEIEKVEKDIFKDLEEYEILNMEALNRENFKYEDLNEEFKNTKNILTYYNDSQFLDYNIMFPKNEEIPNKEYLEQSIDSLIQYINRSIENMNNFERRIRMRSLLSKLELAFYSIDDFSEYISYALNNKIVKNEEINFKINHIYYFLKSL